MVYFSASTWNSLAKCELAHRLKKSPEGKEYLAKQGKSWAMLNGSVLHHAIQSYDTVRYIQKAGLIYTDEMVQEMYFEAYRSYFNDPKIIEKEKFQESDLEILNETLFPTLEKWLFEPDVKKQAELLFIINANQVKLNFTFAKKKPLSWYYSEFFEHFHNYIFNNPLDQLGVPDEVTIEKKYSIIYELDGHDHIITAYVDERRRYGDKVYLIEMKTSATAYTPEDCAIDNQMTEYFFCENIQNETVYENIFVVMFQIPHNRATITQRSEANISQALQQMEERLRREQAIQDGKAFPLAVCGQNSYEHSKLLCDVKNICPVWQMSNSQPDAIILDGN